MIVFSKKLIASTLIWLLITSCAHERLVRTSELEPLVKAQPVADSEIEKEAQDNKKDATLLYLMQAFALLRNGDLNTDEQIKRSKTFLEQAAMSFADLKDPENLSYAFTPDANVPYRGRPHERVLSQMMLALLDMSQERYDMALPTLRDAEFLDARWQPLPYGSQSPMIYALMLLALHHMRAAKADLERAREGLHRSVRLHLLQELFIKTLEQTSDSHWRKDAITVRLAFVLLEAGMSSAFITSPKTMQFRDLLEQSVKEAGLLLNNINKRFENEYEHSIKPALKQVAGVLNDFDEKAMMARIGTEFEAITTRMRQTIEKDAILKKNIANALEETHKLANAVEQSVRQPKVVVRFEGKGPFLVREGNYKEITVIKPSEDGHASPLIRAREENVNLACGIINNGKSVTFVLCDKNPTGQSFTKEYQDQLTKSFELWSSSHQATSVVGRRFDKILAGRAQFRATTEDISTVGAFSALFLFYIGSGMINACNSAGASQECYIPGLAVLGAAAITIVVSGTIWLIGKSTNPAADYRYVPTLFESGYLSVPKDIWENAQ